MSKKEGLSEIGEFYVDSGFLWIGDYYHPKDTEGIIKKVGERGKDKVIYKVYVNDDSSFLLLPKKFNVIPQ